MFRWKHSRWAWMVAERDVEALVDEVGLPALLLLAVLALVVLVVRV